MAKIAKKENLESHIDYIPNDKLPNQAGVYVLVDIKTSKVYIGGTMNIRKRIANHRSLFKHKKHTNKILQKAYKEGCLCVYVLVTLPIPDKDKVKEVEKYFINAMPVLLPNDVLNKNS
ncbi:GIY-YIG catalytic domain-containing protein [Bacillus sp. OV166]|uniref:GIY-YIG nuclease family protein n=1 Tax=Bacillus sp. OV166 TaxID=1882763 RepID=UPI000A2AAC8C|nr:GIY-YIG nuclease family protein [Bacillus sp. OV166]SMQ81524.1 GIY-YIG catalytic domain-containing protein [Bacillus sp. OV166]